MKREKIAAILLIGFVLFICAWMLWNWNSIKEKTVLRGAVGVKEK